MEDAEIQWSNRSETLEARIQQLTEDNDLLRQHRAEDDAYLPTAHELFIDNVSLK